MLQTSALADAVAKELYSFHLLLGAWNILLYRAHETVDIETPMSRILGIDLRFSSRPDV